MRNGTSQRELGYLKGNGVKKKKEKENPRDAIFRDERSEAKRIPEKSLILFET